MEETLHHLGWFRQVETLLNLAQDFPSTVKLIDGVPSYTSPLTSGISQLAILDYRKKFILIPDLWQETCPTNPVFTEDVLSLVGSALWDSKIVKWVNSYKN